LIGVRVCASGCVASFDNGAALSVTPGTWVLSVAHAVVAIAAAPHANQSIVRILDMVPP
jgi:hypothetical protein